MVSAHYDEIERVPNAGEVVFLQLLKMISRELAEKNRAHLQPIHRPPTGLIRRIGGGEHFDHQTLTAILDTLLQERLDLIRRAAIRGLGKAKLPFNQLEVLVEQPSPLLQLQRKETLSPRSDGSL